MIFAGAVPYEFVNVAALAVTEDTFEVDYTEGAIAKTSFSDRALGRLFKATALTELWLHGKVLLGATLTSGVSGGPIFGFTDVNNNFLGGLQHGNNTVELASGNTNITVTSLITRGILHDVDIHYFQSGSTRNVAVYIDGNFVSVCRSNTTWVVPDAIVMGGMGNSTNYFSEVIATEGNVPTIGMRLHSKRPDPSLPGLNTFDSGYWGALANGSLTDGVVTTEDGARLTGGFMAYTGPEAPLGIRGIVQSARYLKNGTLLNLKGQLRISDVNYDTPDYEFDDGNRLISVWEENPVDSAPFQVSDFAGLQGGFYTSL